MLWLLVPELLAVPEILDDCDWLGVDDPLALCDCVCELDELELAD